MLVFSVFFDGIQATCSTLLPPFVPQIFSFVSLQQSMKLHFKRKRPRCPCTTTKEQGTALKLRADEGSAVQHHRNIYAPPYRYEFATQILQTVH